jgi:hypothetical protein
MTSNLIGLEINLGLKDQQPTPWDGEVMLSEGRVREMEIIQGGGPNDKVEGNRYTARTIERMMMQQRVLIRPALRVTVEAPPAARITLQTKQGKAEFALAALPNDVAKKFLDGQISIERQDAPVRLTGKETEDDYPVMAAGRDGTIWLAYIEYVPGQPIIPERLSAGEFETLVPTGNGDQIRLLRFDAKVWEAVDDVTGPGLHVWRPTVTVDGKGAVWIAWSQQVDGDWGIFHRRYTPPARGNSKGQWSEIVRVTQSSGSDFHVVSSTDSNGTVWLAWQSWQKDHFDIKLAAMADNHPWKQPRVISTSTANSWSPAIAADSRGNVFVAYDTYDKANYDVRVFMTGPETKTIDVANSARFEVRPSIVCDAKDRLWIAYEEGDEQWGKDYVGAHFKRIPVEKNLGSALYVTRTIKVKCLVDGKLMQPAGDIEDAFKDRLRRNKSVPRLAIDRAGGLWVFLRHHPLPGGQGEVWNSFAVRYDGKSWSPPRRLTASANLLDNRPALVPFQEGILAVYSGDKRIRTQNRDQDDLFAAILNPTGTTVAPELVAAGEPPASSAPIVHPNETADVARIRTYRIEAGGKTYRFVRGEFHRHTEYSSHNDQDGMVEDSWRYALDGGNLDWMGNGDHDSGFGSEYMWWLLQKMAELHNNPPRFVAAQTYERSVVYPNGHRNVMMPRPGIRPLPRGELPGTAEKGAPDTKRLYAYLRHFGGICASHTSATSMGTDWRDNNGDVEPVVEVYQGHRHNYEHFGAPRAPTKDTQVGGYEPAGFVWNALEKGYKLGFQSSSDHVSTHMSYGMVMVEENSRQGIIDGFKKRHSYAATDNIILDVRSGAHVMGDEFATKDRPTLTIKVKGTGPVARVHVIRDNKYVHTREGKDRDVEIQYVDMEAKPGKTSFYYVRVEQADSNLAWGSPMWITYKPE